MQCVTSIPKMQVVLKSVKIVPLLRRRWQCSLICMLQLVVILLGTTAFAWAAEATAATTISAAGSRFFLIEKVAADASILRLKIQIKNSLGGGIEDLTQKSTIRSS